LSQTIKTHESGFISAIKWDNGKLYCGGKDGKVVVIETAGLTV
jgi:hypothetical protein